MKRSMRPCPAAARTLTASAQRHRRSSEIAKRHGATSTQICARPAARSFAGDAADSRHLFIRAPEGNLAALEIELTDAEFDALR
jgi:hypothetical protein